ncbi:MAG: T9SS type A sorting domain-containing protein [Alphaproteobacteria bacterium]|nr:T9SS type A sorting domain-containing protein [Alphaproteobacteria bacterium]
MRWHIAVILMLFTASLAAQDDAIFFSDSPDGDELYDASWGYEKAPSDLELAGGNDKFPVDAQHPYKGAHSLRLHWTSQSGGDWGIAVASPGWSGHDFTVLDSIVYWVNAPAAVSAADLPQLALEDLSNNKSTRVNVGDYLTAGVDGDTATWQKVMIPISDLQPGTENCDFTRIKTIFHYQFAADGTEHILWLDEIKAIKSGSGGSGEAPARVRGLIAEGHDSRIDLRWRPNTEADLQGYYVYRAQAAAGPYAKVNAVTHAPSVYSDFLGENDKTCYYYVTAVNLDFTESPPSDTVSAATFAMSDEELLVSVQEATFRYFYDYGHPVSGLALERKGSGDVCTSGGTGMGLLTMMVGAERGFEARDSIAARILKILTFLQDVTPRYHGAWSHWINGTTGETIPFSAQDDGGDLVETAYLVQGLLAVRQYFDADNALETEIRSRATQMWEGVEWDWYRRTDDTDGKYLYWHWSPNYGWAMNFRLEGFNETMITYLLAIASPTHPVPASLYYDGWASSYNYVNGNEYYGYKQWVGWPLGGPLFFTQYSFLGFDPRNKSDIYCNYFDNNRNISLINRAYCIDNPGGHSGYSELVWGLTSSDDPWGYSAHEPQTGRDNGTITPTAAISAMPYVPEESIATLKHFYFTYGPDLWGEFGFRDAFNLDENWFATSYLAIDQGTQVPMIENYLTQLPWNMFMANEEIPAMLDSIGWVVGLPDENPPLAQTFKLEQNFPNPFNPFTAISYQLSVVSQVELSVYNVLGQKVRTLVNKRQAAGRYSVVFRAGDLPSGVYVYRLKAGGRVSQRKMILLK